MFTPGIGNHQNAQWALGPYDNPQEADPTVRFGPKIGVLLDSSKYSISEQALLEFLPESLI
jgi:hypothetical protein